MKISLQIKATLENVTNLKPKNEDFRWYLKLKCLSCMEETSNCIYFTETDGSALKGGRGSASVVLKCKMCKRQNSIDILTDTLSPYTADDAEKFKSIVTFDCRGVEPTFFDSWMDWTVYGTETGSLFENVDLKSKEWYDYDEKGQQTVSITELEYKFVPTK